MKISEATKSILKNFSDINQNLLGKPGSELKTISTMKNILATAKVEEEFTTEFGIYDLSEFLGVLSLFKRPFFPAAIIHSRKVTIRHPILYICLIHSMLFSLLVFLL